MLRIDVHHSTGVHYCFVWMIAYHIRNSNLTPKLIQECHSFSRKKIPHGDIRLPNTADETRCTVVYDMKVSRSNGLISYKYRVPIHDIGFGTSKSCK